MASPRALTAPPPGTGPSAYADPLLWFGVVVWALSILPSLFPVFSADLTYTYADQYSDAVPLLVVFVAMGFASRTPLSRERTFWFLLMGTITAWLGTRAVYAFVSVDQWSAGWDLTTDLLYLAGYLLVAIALERRPDRSPAQGYAARFHQVGMVGTLVFAFGLLGYFIVIPKVFNPEAYASWVPSLLLYAVLDAYLLIRVFTVLKADPRGGWRWPYRWLVVTFALWMTGDVIEGLLYLDAIAPIEPGTPWDLIWHLPSLTFLLAVLSRGWPDPESEGDDGVPVAVRSSFRPGGHSLTAFALALPVLHFSLGILGMNDPAVARAQMSLLLILVLVFGGLLVWYQILLRKMAVAIEADRTLVSDQLQMAQRMEAVGRLAAGVAHDFSNVLSVIRGRAELLLMDGGMAPDAKEDVDEVVEATRRGQALITHLLTISRRKSGDPHTLDLSDVTQDVRDLLHRVLPDTLTLVVEISEEQALVVADRAQLEQVVLNLVLNARDALKGRGTIRVTTAVVEVDDQFAAAHGGEAGGAFSVLRVADSGPGVPPEIRELVFEPFFTTKDGDSGSGLGLAAVYGIVRNARGLVRLADSEDGGALFEVYLPLAQGVAARAIRSAGGKPLRGKEAVLLVENDGPVRRTTARILREAGYRVIEAENAVVALAILERRNETVDVMVTDLALPDLSGYELQVRALERKPGLAVVIVSGHPEDVTSLLAPENTLVLRKPVAPDLLTLSVRRALADAQKSVG